MDQEPRRKILAGARLRRVRSEIGISQSAMANELGISISYLNLIERNLRPVTAQLLIRLSETYGIDPSSFAQDEEQIATSELAEILSDEVFRPIEISRQEIRALVEQAPSIGDALKKLYGSYLDLREFQSAAAGGMSDSERGGASLSNSQDTVENIRNFLQHANNHFPAVEEAARLVVEKIRQHGCDLLSALSAHLHQTHSIRVQIMPVAIMGKTLRRFDVHRRKILISELVEPSGRAFQVAYHLGLLESGAVIDDFCNDLENKDGQVRKLARVSLANYFAAAVMMPYEEFLKAAEELAYDVDVLSARFSASFEQVAHRLTTLSRPSARGIPFFMIRVDNAGNVSKRFSSGSFPFAKYGGTCPRWNIHQTFSNPRRVETQIIELPDGAKWFSLAKTVRRLASPWGEDDSQFVVGLGCELKYANRLVYAKGLDLKSLAATPIGVNCRLCERRNCVQRAAPPLLKPIEVNENIRGYSPFDADLTR